MRKENIDLRLQCQDVFPQIGINDVFLKIYLNAVENNSHELDWLTFCPHEFLQKTGIVIENLYGEDFENAYSVAVDLFNKKELLVAKMNSSRLIVKTILETYKETGLPYIFNKDYANECNPNKELGIIRSSNLCVASYTLLRTKDGSFKIEDLVDRKVEVWNGLKWSYADVFKTGESQLLDKVIVYFTTQYDDNSTSSGVIELECTKYHKWYDINGKEMRTHELKSDMELLGWRTPELDGYVKAYILGVVEDHIIADTYCVTEPERHMAVFNGVLTGNCVESFSNIEESMAHVCSLYSVNLANCKTLDDIESATKYSVKALNRTVQLSYSPIEETKRHNDFYRIIGVGVLGYHDHLVLNGMNYTNSKDFAYDIAERIAYWAIEQSVDDVSLYGQAPAFSNSEWNKGIFFGRNVYDKSFTNNKEMSKKWISLYENKVAKVGMANCGLLAIAPNTSTSQLTNSSASILPVFKKYFIEKNKLMSVPFVAKYLSDETFWLYQEGINISPDVVINVAQNFQQWVDQGISLELILNSNIYNSAINLRDWWIKALVGDFKNKRSKTLYYLRPIEISKDSSCTSCAN